MKLPVDQNLSPQLAVALADLFPDSIHVRSIGLREGDDGQFWSHAASHDYIILTKDNDFAARARVQGPPPFVVQIRFRNGPTHFIEESLRRMAYMVDRLRGTKGALFLEPREEIVILHFREASD